MQSGRDLALTRFQARVGNGFNLLAHRGKLFHHEREIGRGNFDDVDRVERGACRRAFY